MSKISINEALALTKAVRERVNELKGVRTSVSTKDRWFNAGIENKVSEPQYDVKAVDKKITELELFLFKVDAAVKQSNAFTKLDMNVNIDELLAPLV